MKYVKNGTIMRVTRIVREVKFCGTKKLTKELNAMMNLYAKESYCRPIAIKQSNIRKLNLGQDAWLKDEWSDSRS
jgi:hypothetical protein